MVCAASLLGAADGTTGGYVPNLVVKLPKCSVELIQDLEEPLLRFYLAVELPKCCLEAIQDLKEQLLSFYLVVKLLKCSVEGNQELEAQLLIFLACTGMCHHDRL